MTGHRRIRLGMVGGGIGGKIGAVHRAAARLDDRYELVAGALSASPERARESGLALGLAEDRCYPDFEAMAAAESTRPDGIGAVAIVTPNHLHFGPAKAFLDAGIHVICDKPMTATLDEAEALARIAAQAKARFFLTHTYSGYPMLRQARAMVAAGEIGEIRLVQVEYVQDWMVSAPEASGNKQAEWRVDPARSGAGGAIGDIGTHAYHLAGFVSGLDPESLFADLSSFGAGRRLDDNAGMLLRYANGARGMLWASQVAPGNENTIRLRVYGTKGGLDWTHEEATRLWHTPLAEPKRLMTQGGVGSMPASLAATRVPAGHPEGYFEAFANLYRDIADAIQGKGDAGLVPGAEEGLEGLRFIDAAVRSARSGSFVSIERTGE